MRACTAACSCLNGASARGGCPLRGVARDGGACMQPFQARLCSLAHKRTSLPRARLAPSNPVVPPRIRPHGDSQAREQDHTAHFEGQLAVLQGPELQVQRLSLSLAFGQEDCPLRPVTQRHGSHALRDSMMRLRLRSRRRFAFPPLACPYRQVLGTKYALYTVARIFWSDRKV